MGNSGSKSKKKGKPAAKGDTMEQKADNMDAIKITTAFVGGLAVGTTVGDVGYQSTVGAVKGAFDISNYVFQNSWDGIVKVAKEATHVGEFLKDGAAHVKEAVGVAGGAVILCGVGATVMMRIGDSIHRRVKQTMNELTIQEENYRRLVDAIVRETGESIDDLPHELGLLHVQFGNLKKRVADGERTLSRYAKKVKNLQLDLDDGLSPKRVSERAEELSEEFDEDYSKILEAFNEYIEHLKKLKGVVTDMRKKAESAKKGVRKARLCYGMAGTFAVAGIVILCIPGINIVAAGGAAVASGIGLGVALGIAIAKTYQTYDTEQQVDNKIKMLKQFEDQIQNMVEDAEGRKEKLMKEAEQIRAQLETLKKVKEVTNEEFVKIEKDFDMKRGA